MKKKQHAGRKGKAKHPLKKGKKNKESPKVDVGTSAPRPKQLVVFDGAPSHDWCQLFEGFTLADGSSLRVIQASWMEVEVNLYEDMSNCIMHIAPIRESEGMVERPRQLSVQPDFVLVRNQVRGPRPTQDRRNVLYGLLMANVPSLNSLESLYMDLERPLMYSQLAQIRDRVGRDKFPLIRQNFYSSPSCMAITPTTFPSIMKVSHAHAGMGKVKLDNEQCYRDLTTVLALHGDYCTTEPFVEVDYGIRVQKIGPSYRVYKKVMTGSTWKSQFGGSDLQEIELTDEFKLWADECAKCYGGMDLLAVDALHSKHDGSHTIIELNGSAIGIVGEHWIADSRVICEMVVDRMNRIYCGVSEDSETLAHICHDGKRKVTTAATEPATEEEEEVASDNPDTPEKRKGKSAKGKKTSKKGRKKNQ